MDTAVPSAIWSMTIYLVHASLSLRIDFTEKLISTEQIVSNRLIHWNDKLELLILYNCSTAMKHCSDWCSNCITAFSSSRTYMNRQIICCTAVSVGKRWKRECSVLALPALPRRFWR
jgi:hypothetical protein